jgi:hypothetical protein
VTDHFFGWFDNQKETNHAKKQLERKTVSVEELALSNAYQLEAMINVLKRKGIGRERSPRRTGSNFGDKGEERD